MANMATSLASAAFALAAVDAAAFPPLPLGAAGVLAPQLSIAVAVPVLPAAVLGVAVVGLAVYGGYAVYKKAADK